MTELHQYIDVKQKQKDKSFRANYEVGEVVGGGYFGSGIDECREKILRMVGDTIPVDTTVAVQSVQELEDVIEGLIPLSEEDIELLVMTLNDDHPQFTVGQIKSFIPR